MYTHKDGTLPNYPAIFVFGSNLAVMAPAPLGWRAIALVQTTG